MYEAQLFNFVLSDKSGAELQNCVEYDMDDADEDFLWALNYFIKKENENDALK